MRRKRAALVDLLHNVLPGHQLGIAYGELLRSTFGLGGPESVDLGLIGVIGVETRQQA